MTPHIVDKPAKDSRLPLLTLMNRYSVVLVSVGFAAAGMLILRSHTQAAVGPFLLYYPAVIVSVWLGGLGAGLAATILCPLVNLSYHASNALEPLHLLSSLVFLASGAFISVAGTALRRKPEWRTWPTSQSLGEPANNSLPDPLAASLAEVANKNSELLASERQARSQAERANRMKDEFLSTLSHELRTPMNSILGWAQILRGEDVDAEDLNKGLETIERNAAIQAQLIDDLLDMSRIISGRIRLEVEPVDLAHVIAIATETIRPAIEAKGLQIRSIVDSKNCRVFGDPSRLQQIIWNLLSNAVKFTPKGGKITITLTRINSHLQLTVADSGLGIRPDFLPHVFERFRQEDSSITRKFGGMGLGLSIVKQLTELHGGTVEASSAGEGRGSKFQINLPVMALRDVQDSLADNQQSLEHSKNVTPDLRNIRILVVDDEPDARTLIERILTRCDADIDKASSAKEALAKFQVQQPDLLISDIGLPDMDGLDLIRAIRQLPDAAGTKTPAIALTAYARVEDRLRSLRAGFQMHITKPVEPAELIATVASLLNLPATPEG